MKTTCELLGEGKVRFTYPDGTMKIRFLTQEEFALAVQIKQAVSNYLIGSACDELFGHYLSDKESKELRTHIAAEISSCNTVTS